MDSYQLNIHTDNGKIPPKIVMQKVDYFNTIRINKTGSTYDLQGVVIFTTEQGLVDFKNQVIFAFEKYMRERGAK